MFQGTASSVGKSIISAAFCRIFNDEGLKVSPFKSQNMALNSYVTIDGKEMGRAQVVQAEASRVAPMVEMNPILLKPTSDVGSQVIINGKVYKNLKAKDYFDMKVKLKDIVLRAYNNLNSSFDVIVIEGAGSPAEINLRENDIVNMGLAEMVDSPVILIGDIDCGGVFASLYGTVMLLSENERARIKGFLINKFRGDVEILKPGIKMIEQKIKKPCLGVIPYMDLQIDDEDSVTNRFIKKSNGEIVIGVINLPYMSNFTDFTALEAEQDVNLRYVYNEKELLGADLVIIPGSKNTIKDVQYIFNSNLDKAIYKKRKEGIPIIGICGGYQILGQEISDPDLVESACTSINGLSLLNIKTKMLKDKQTKQVKGRVITKSQIFQSLENNIVSGYEIHMGQTELLKNTSPIIRLDDGRYDGAVSQDGKVIGTYLHGIFDNDEFRNSILNVIRKKKGLQDDSTAFSYKELKEKEYDKLAQIVKKNCDVQAIKKIMELG